MPDDEREENEEEDEYVKRFRELEEKTASIRQNSAAPELPEMPTPRAQPTQPKTAQPKRETPPHVQRGMGIAFAIGYSFVGPLLAGILIGTLLDGKPGGTWTIVGILLGTIIAFALLIRLVNKLNEDG